MTTPRPTKLLTPADFDACPLWRYDDGDDLDHPVISTEEIPELERELFTKAIFTTRAGDTLEGCVIGISYVFSIGLFGGDKVFILNKNMEDHSRQQVNELLALHPSIKARTFDELFPVKYRTTIGRLGYREFSGSFEFDR